MDLVQLSEKYIKELIAKRIVENNEFRYEEEFAAFITFAITCPRHYHVSAHIYNVTKSGLPNFCAVALALAEIGYKALGIRIDSSNCAENSHVIRLMFKKIAAE